VPTYYLAPDPCQSTFLVPGSNTPGNGVLVFTYATGTTTKVTVAKDTAGAAFHTNPIVLDSGGNLPSGSSMFIEDGVVIDVVYAPSNDTDPPASAYKTISNVRGVEPTAAAPTEWLSGSTGTYVSATQFTIEGDQTATYHVGRRVRVVDSGGTKYARITSTAFGSSTTVGLFGDALTTGVSTVAYGILSATNPSTSLLTEFYPLVRSSTAAHTLTANLQSYTSSHVVTWPDYEVSITSSQTVNFATNSSSILLATTVPQTVSDLRVPLGANTEYSVNLKLWFFSGSLSTTGFQVAPLYPDNAFVRGTWSVINSTIVFYRGAAFTTTSDVLSINGSVLGNDNKALFEMNAMVSTGSAGTYQVRFACSTAAASLTLISGSALSAGTRYTA